jgi:hypothetical protein
MIKLFFDQDMLKNAQSLSVSMGELRNSITGGGGNFAGFLGELALANHIKAKRDDDYGHDLMYRGRRIEVKTKRRTVDPCDHYEGSVALASSHQTPDYYAFMSITYDNRLYKLNQLRSVWFCGILSYNDFMEKSIIYRVGDKDPSNGFIVLSDMRNIPYSMLNKITKKSKTVDDV